MRRLRQPYFSLFPSNSLAFRTASTAVPPRDVVSVLDTFATTVSSAVSFAGTAAGGVRAGPADGIDPFLIQQAKAEIRGLVREITELTQADIPREEFFAAFLDRVVSALAAVGGALWTPDATGGWRLQYHIHLTQTRLGTDERASARHARLLQQVASTGQATCVSPDCGGSGEADAGNPTEWLLLLAPLRVDDRVQGFVEVFQRPRGGPVTQRGYLRFLVQMCDLASEYLKNRRLRQLNGQQQWWAGTEQFFQAIHRRLDLRATAFAVANEGRRLLGVDRVSVVVRRGSQCQVVAVSGLDSLDRRAEEVLRMTRLASSVISVGQPLWHPRDAESLPPQLEDAVQQYVDRSHARIVAVLPLAAPEDPAPGETASPAIPFGVLVVERFQDARVPEDLPPRVDALARYSAAALRNALEHESLFLLPLWRALGQTCAALQTNARRKAAAGAITAIAVVLGCVFLPVELRIAAPGRLQPAVRQDVFAPLDGTVEEVLAEHGQEVHSGQVLARLRNTDLAVEIAGVIGRKTTVQEQMLAIQRSLLKHEEKHLPAEERNRLASELTQAKQLAESLDRQLELLRCKEQQLIIRCPTRGQVVTWQVRQTLQQRPVQTGQLLMSIVDPEAAWQLELDVPERDVGHVIAATRRTANGGNPEVVGLPATFQLHTHPGQEFAGRVVEIQRTAELGGDGGQRVRARATLEKQGLPDLRSDVTVDARISCGRRSLGYVWFRDVIETARAQVAFWWD